MKFDVDGARKAGYSDSEIADHLGQQSSFDVLGARKAGYSDGDIVAHLTAPEPETKKNTFLGGAKDVAASIVMSPMSLASGLYGLADLSTGGMLDRATGAVMGEPMSEKFGRARDIASDFLYSDALKEKQQRLAAIAKDKDGGGGFLPAIGYMLSNPDLLAASLGESFAPMAGMAAATRANALRRVAGATAEAEKAVTAGRMTAAEATKFVDDAVVQAGGRANVAVNFAAEAGDTALEVKRDVLKTPFEQLERDSKEYRDLVASGVSREEARLRLAERAEFVGGITAGVIGAAASKLTGSARLEAALFSGRGGMQGGAVRRTLTGTGKESLEEGAQGAGDEFGANLGKAVGANDAQNLMEGVPGAAGIGVVTGAVMGAGFGAVSKPEGGPRGVDPRFAEIERRNAAETARTAAALTAINRAPTTEQAVAAALAGTSEPFHMNDVLDSASGGIVADAMRGVEDAGPAAARAAQDAAEREAGYAQMDQQAAERSAARQEEISRLKSELAPIPADAAAAQRNAEIGELLRRKMLEDAVDKSAQGGEVGAVGQALQRALGRQPGIVESAMDQPATPAPAQQEAGAAPVSAVTGPASDRKGMFASQKIYSVDTEDNGKLRIRLARLPDGGAVLFDEGGGAPIEHNAAFVGNKSDEDLLRYSFEPLGYRSATEERASTGPTTGVRGFPESVTPAGQATADLAAIPPSAPSGTANTAVREIPKVHEETGQKQAKNAPISPSVPQESVSPVSSGPAAESVTAAPVDVAASAAATSPQNALPEPTDAQKEAGNYPKGHDTKTLRGLDLSIENAAGSKRRPEWPTLQQHYGYVKGSVGMDKDHLDVFVKPGTPEDWKGTVYVVNQNKEDGRPDEHKAMVGFDSLEAARAAYLSNYTAGWEKNVHSIVPIRSDKFAAWATDKSNTGPAGGFLKSGSPHVQIMGKSVHAMTERALKTLERDLGKKVEAGKRLTPKQREQLDAAREELDRRAEVRGARPMSEAEAARREKLKADAKARRQIDVDKDSIIPAIIKLGGLKDTERPDIIRDDAGNVGIPGVGHLFTRKGLEVDGMVEALQQYGYLSQKELADVDGGAEALRQKVGEEFGGQRKHWSLESDAAMREAAERAAEAAEAQAEAADAAAAEAGAELDLAIDPAELADIGVTDDAVTMARAEMAARAEALEEGVTERLAMQHDTDDAYWAAVAQFLKEREHGPVRDDAQDQRVRQEEGAGSRVPEGDRAPAQTEDAVAAGEEVARPALDLQPQTEADLRAKAAQAETGNVEERAAALRDRNDAILTPPAGTAPPASVEAARVPKEQQGLFAAADALAKAAEALKASVQPAAAATEQPAQETASEALESAWRSLDKAERDAVDREVGREAFEVAVTGWLEGKRAAVNEWLKDVSNTVREAFRKVVAMLAAVAVALNVQSVQEAQAMPVPTGPATVKVQELVEKPRADFGGSSASAKSTLVANWIMATNAHQGEAFLVADKAAGVIHAFGADGALIESSPALYGESQGDTMTAEQMSKPMKAMTRADKITPAGRWTVSMKPNKDYGWVLDFKGGEGLAVHAVYLGTPAERRASRLMSAGPADNYVTYGCINVPKAYAEGVLRKNFAGAEHGLFIIPMQTEATEKVFGIMAKDMMPDVVEREVEAQSAKPVGRGIGATDGMVGDRQRFGAAAEKGAKREPTPPATPEELAQAREYEERTGFAPYLPEGEISIPLEMASLPRNRDYDPNGPAFSIKRDSDYGLHPTLGLPLNANGTVTLYVPTTNEEARRIVRERNLRGAPGANRIYLTNESSAAAVTANPGGIEQPMGGANVLVQVDPSTLQLDRVHPDGRRDFFIPIAEGEAYAERMSQWKFFTINKSRTEAISGDVTLKNIEDGIAEAVEEYKGLSRKERQAKLKAARQLLKAQHNVTTLLSENGKLQKTRVGEHGLTYDGDSVASLGLGLASAQKINDRNLNVCPQRAICEGLCLGETSGQNRLYGGEGQHRSGPRLSQYLKTEALVMHPREFAIVLYAEIESFNRWAAKKNGFEKVKDEESGQKVSVPKQVYAPAIRLNVTSDFAPRVFRAVIDAFPGTMFYDYTKLNSDTIAPNHHLTYSSTGASQVVAGEQVVNPHTNWPRMVERLRSGKNVAMAFTSRTDMPTEILDEASGERFQVWNGDNYDARFLDPKPGEKGNRLGKGMIVGLTNKDRTTNPADAAKKYNGFFLDYDRARDGDTLVIRDQSKFGRRVVGFVPMRAASRPMDTEAEIQRMESEGGRVEQRVAAYNPAQLELVYDGAETRPDTTHEQRSAGIAALRALFARDRRAGATVLGSRLWKDFTQRKGAELIGQRAESAQELGLLAQILRDPRFETLRFFFVKDGKVVGHTATTSRMPGYVQFVDYSRSASPGGMEGARDKKLSELRAMMENLGADGYYMMHNHPSGTPLPSNADVLITQSIAADLDGFLGHIIVDSTAFSVLDAKGKRTMHQVPDGDREPELPHDALGAVIRKPQDVVGLAKSIQRRKGYATVIAADAQGRVNAIAEVPEAMLDGDTKVEQMKAMARLRRFARMTGSGMGIFVVTEHMDSKEFLIENKIAFDVIQPGRRASLRETVIPKRDLSYKTTAMAAEQPTPVYTTGTDNRPRLEGNGVSLTDPAFLWTMYGQQVYQSKIIADGRHVGHLTLGWKGGKVASLVHIEIAPEERGNGYAEAAVKSILQHNGDAELHVMSIQPDARDFWLKLGTDPFDTETGEDGVLTEKAYLSARGDQGDSQADRAVADRQGTDAGNEVGPRAPGFSRKDGRQALGGYSKAEVRSIIEPVLASWGNAPTVIVVESMQDPAVPEQMRAMDAEQRASGARGEPEGFIYGNRVYLVASALHNPWSVYRVLFHESLGHYGLRGVFGAGMRSVLSDVADSMPTRVRAKAKQYGWDFDNEFDRMRAAEEVLAEIAQTRPNAGIVKRAIAAIRRFLRDLGIDLDLSDNDIVVNFILPARAFVEGKRNSAGVAPREVGAFQRDFTKSDAFRRWFGASKVVDAEGNPLVVYHGSPYDDIVAFESGWAGSTTGNRGWFGEGFYFTPNRDTARGYAAHIDSGPHARKGKVYPVYLSIQNPLEIASWDSQGLFRTLLKSKSLSTESRAALTSARAKLEKMYGKNNRASVIELTQDPELKMPPKLLSKIIQEAGYDGVIALESPSDGSYEVIAFRPEQIKSAIGNRGTFDQNDPRIDYSRAPSPWYSDLARAVEKTSMKAAPTKGWQDFLKGQVAKGTVKADEVSWSGIDDWLALQTGKVTREQVMDFLDQNGVRVEETVLGGDQADAGRQAVVELDARGYDIEQEPSNANGELVPVAIVRRSDAARFDITPTQENYENLPVEEDELDGYRPITALPDDLRALAQQLIDGAEAEFDPQEGQAKFGSYTIPGGKNYRELLLTLPGKMREYAYDAFNPKTQRSRQFKSRAEAEAFANEDATNQTVVSEVEVGTPEFRSSHFGQPNILAHIRLNERTDADGKRVLFVEEIQSDWAQKGKKEGFVKEPDGVAVDRVTEPGFIHILNAAGDRVGGYSENAAGSMTDSALLERYNAGAGGSNRVPAAPFVTKTEAWVALALKRVIRYASENGFDRVAFTTGKQQADRYGLDKTAKSIEVTPRTNAGTGERTRAVRIELLAGGAIQLGVDAKGIVDNVSGNISGQHVEGKHLSDVIGKEMAERVMASDKATFAGDDLKVGGKGMMYFYDRIVQNVANDVLKKLGGGRVGEVKLGKTEGLKLNKKEIADEAMRYIEGDIDAEELIEAIDSPSVTPALIERWLGGVNIHAGRSQARTMAMNFAGDVADAALGQKRSVQPGFDITPALREKALGGVPMFSRSPSIAGADTTGDYRDSITSRATSFVREMLHSDRRFSWWHRTIGTQQHKAQINRDFGKVYDEGQAFISDVSKYANEAADAAADVLPRIDSFKDFGKASPKQGDVDLATEALYAGTLWGGGSPLEGRIWTDEELKAGGPLDSAVRFNAFQPLNDTQIKLYRQALASVSTSLDALGKSIVHKLVRQHGIGFDREMSLEDVAAMVAERIEDTITDKSVELEYLTDADRLAAEAEQVAADAEGSPRDPNGSKAAAAYLRQQQEASEKVQREIDELEALKTQVADVAQKTKALQDSGYFPAQRFGQYAIHVVERDGAGKPVQRYFGMYETQTQANLAARELAKEYPNADIERGMMSKEQYRLFQGLNLDALEAFADHITGEDGAPISKDPLVQGFLKAAVSERSVMKRHLHRKGVLGYSKDMTRVLANFTVSTARATSSNYHSAQMLRLANDIRQGDVKDEAIKLVRYLQDPQEEAQAIRGLLFTQFLGGSIAHGIVNMTQPVMVTLPYLTQHTSAADATAKIGEAMAAKPEKLTGAIREAYLRAKKEGVVAPQEIHQLRAETGGAPVGRSIFARKLSFLWGSIYSITEQFNRTTSFLAAYRIAEQKGMKDPYAFAVEAVNQTQFVYNKGARPNWARGPIGATVFTFKQFSISYLELAKRIYQKDKKAFALMVLMLLMAAGLEGLPFAEDLEDLVDTLGQWMGYSTNSKKSLRKWAVATLGPDLAQVALKGISGLPFMPVDVSVRMGLHNLVPGTAMLKPSEKNKARDVLEIVGPVGQFVPTEDTLAGKALEKLFSGDVLGALKAAGPVAVQNVLKGAEMADKGYATDGKGKKIAPVTTSEAVLKMAGLQPATVARESAKMSVVKQDIDLQRKVESDIADRWARGVVDGRPEEVRAAMKQMHDWNRDNPELRIRIGMDQIRRRVREMQTPREQRFIKSAPPEIRSGVREALRQ